MSQHAKARIAHAMLGTPSASPRLGHFILRDEQHDAVRRIRQTIAGFGGALLADPPGTGKTIVALAVASAYPRALVVGPATLRAQWERAAHRAGVDIAFRSLESLSRDAEPPAAPFIIVDEAHHARTPTTKRYRRLADRSAGVPLLLLTATPVVNRRHDRDALLALFLGERARALSPSEVARLVIRREAVHVHRPRVIELPPLALALAPLPIAEHLLRLPPPLPASDGREALALVRLSLAMAWASSLAALEAALRRRIQRGESLAESLDAGRWPERSALRQWIVGDDATQLAMPLLLTDVGDAPPADARCVLNAHLDAVRALRTLVRPEVAPDASARASALRQLAADSGDNRIVVFCSHAATVRALFRALRAMPSVMAITGARVMAAQGRWSRAEVLAALGPQGSPWRRDDPRGIRLLLTSDFLAEGVELQGAGVVVHGDVAWTPARFEQRVGRVARIGGGAEVQVTRFPMPDAAQEMLDLDARLARKERARQRAVAAPRVAAETRAALDAWHHAGADQEAPRAPRACVLAAVRGSLDGFLALLRTGAGFELVGGRFDGDIWTVHETPREISSLVAAAGDDEVPLDRRDLRAIRRALHRWCSAAQGADAVGLAHGSERPLRRAVRRRLDAALRNSPLAARAATAARWGAAVNTALATPGAGTAQALARLLRTRPDPAAFADALEALATQRHHGASSAARRHATRPRLSALLRIVAAEGPQAPPRPSGKATRSRSAISLA